MQHVGMGQQACHGARGSRDFLEPLSDAGHVITGRVQESVDVLLAVGRNGHFGKANLQASKFGCLDQCLAHGTAKCLSDTERSAILVQAKVISGKVAIGLLKAFQELALFELGIFEFIGRLP